MDPERAILALLVIVALLGGVWIGRTSFSGDRGPVAEESFRAWFWEQRGLDLAVQATLIFVGALGTAALLPRGREDDEE